MKSLVRSIAAASIGVFGLTAAPAAFAEKPQIVRQVPPEYPRGAERRGIEGEVTAAVDIDSAGKVLAVSIVDATPPGVFDAAVERALMRWRFEENKPLEGVRYTLVFQQ